MMAEHWLAVFDLDKTLLTKEEIITDYTLAVLKEFKRQGGKVAIATGRSIVRSKAYADLIEADGITTLNGSSTFIKGKLIHQIPIDEKKVCALIQEFKKIEDLYIMVDYPTRIITNNPKWVQPGFREHCDFENFETHEIQNIKLDTLNIEALRKIDFDYYGVRHIESSNDPSFHVIASKEVDKKFGVLKLLETFNIDQDHLIVFGDDYNDVGMFEMAKMSVLVQNGAQDLKQYVKEVTLTNNEEGPALFMNKYFDLKVNK